MEGSQYILTIDPAIKTLSICIVEVKEPKIIFWDTFSLFDSKVKLKSLNKQVICQKILEKFDSLFLEEPEVFEKVKKIYIELQPRFNPLISFVSKVIFTKFVEYYRETASISFVSARKKTLFSKDLPEEIRSNLEGIKNSYSRRKKTSVELCKFKIKEKFSIEESDKWLNFLETFEKWDDLSDTFCMTLEHLK